MDKLSLSEKHVSTEESSQEVNQTDVPAGAQSVANADRYRAVAELTTDFAYSVRFLDDGEMEMEWSTGAYEEVTGLPLEEANSFGHLNLIHPEDLPLVKDRLGRLLAGEEVHASYRIVRPDGEVRWLRSVARPEMDMDGKVTRLLGATSDVTKAREAHERMERAEAALRESEARYRQLIEHVPAVVYIAEPGPEGDWQYVSPQIEKLLGFSQKEWVADANLWARQIHPEDRDRILRAEEDAAHLATIAGHQEDVPPLRTEYRMLARDGSIVWVRDDAYFFPTGKGEPGLFQGVMLDITGRKRAEEALSKSEEQYRSLFHGIPIGLYRTSPDGRILEANQALADIFGYPDVESLEAIAPEDLYVDTNDRQRWKQQLEEDGQVLDFEMLHRRTDGELIWIRDSARAVRDGENRVLHYEGKVEDVTERKRAEDALKESETRFRLIAENAKDIIYRYRVKPTPGYEYVSPAITSITGYTPEEVYADPDFLMKAAHPEDLPEVLELFESGRAFTETYSTRWLTKDGRTIWCETRNAPIHDESGELFAFVGITRDVSDQVAAKGELEDSLIRLRRSDEQRRHLLSRLVAAQEEERRRLAGEIHDDSVQVMAAVGLRLEILERKLGAHEAVRSVLPELRRDVQTGVQRLRQLIFDLRPLALDRDGLVAALRLHLERPASDSDPDYKLVDRLLEEPPDHVRMVLYRIAQEAIANAHKHARAGRITLTVDSVGNSVILRVADDGCGFAPDRSDFSAPGHLGLLAMHEQAEMVGGELTIQSAPDSGTTVEARVPLSNRDAHG
ncbi:MAG: PAS domain S-box protein [Actinomycetota bacterium]